MSCFCWASVSGWHFRLFCCLGQRYREEVACAWSTVRRRAAVWIRKFCFCWVRLEMELHRIWLVLGYVGWYWVILAVTELCWLVLSYIGCYRVMLAGTELYWLLPSYVGWYWVILAVSELCWLVLSYIGCYRVMLAGTELFSLLPSYVG